MNSKYGYIFFQASTITANAITFHIKRNECITIYNAFEFKFTAKHI